MKKRTAVNNNDLYDIAASNGTAVWCFAIPENQSISLMAADGSTCIGIDPFAFESSADERVHLAHELGHCVTGAFYNVYAPLDIRAKHERRAEIWAIKKLIPKDELISALCDGYTEPSELAEYFNITEDFIQRSLAYYFY